MKPYSQDKSQVGEKEFFVSVAQASKRLGISAHGMRYHIYQGNLFAIKILGRWSVFLDEYQTEIS